MKIIPKEVLAECFLQAKEIMLQGKPVNRLAAVIIIYDMICIGNSSGSVFD